MGITRYGYTWPTGARPHLSPTAGQDRQDNFKR